MIRKAQLKDIKQIQALVNFFAKQNLMLPRSLNELYENLRDFWVCEDKKQIIGCVALHVSWEDLAEIKSLAVKKNRQHKGIGNQLINTCIDEAKELGIKRIFALTFRPEFFKKFGFTKTKHSNLPHKIWAECINCHKFPNCQEIALVKKI
jgi:amino-acid N-acetyltransferase